MQMNKKILLISATAMVVIGGGLTSFGLAKGASPVVEVGNNDAGFYTGKKESGTIDISEFDTLTLDSKNCDVLIRGGDEYKLEYNVTNKSYIPEVSQNGKHLTVNEHGTKSVFVFSAGFPGEFDLSDPEKMESSLYDYVITVPKDGGTLNVDIVSDTDDIKIKDVFVNGTVKAKSADVKISNVSSDDLFVSSETGEVYVENGSFDKLKIETRTDEVIVVNCIMTDLDAQSKSDKIELNNIEVDTANLKALDDISIRISGEDDYSYDLTPGIGDEVEMGTNTIEGSYKSESLRGKSITAKSETGDINISFAKK